MARTASYLDSPAGAEIAANAIVKRAAEQTPLLIGPMLAIIQVNRDFYHEPCEPIAK